MRAALDAQRALERAGAVARGEAPPERRKLDEIRALVSAVDGSGDPSQSGGVELYPAPVATAAESRPQGQGTGRKSDCLNGAAAAARDPEPRATLPRTARWSKGRQRGVAQAAKRGRATVASYSHARGQFDQLRARRPALGAAVKRALDGSRWTLRHEHGRRLLAFALSVETWAVPTVYYSRDVARRRRGRAGRMTKLGDTSLWTISKRAFCARGYTQGAFARCLAGQGFDAEDSRVTRQTVARYAHMLAQAGGIQVVHRNPEAPEWARGAPIQLPGGASLSPIINEYWMIDETLRKPGLVSQWATADGEHDTSALEQPWAGAKSWPQAPQPPPV